MLNKQQWLEEHRGYYGGTAAAAVIHMHKYKSPLEVWLEMTGQSDEKDAGVLAQMGTLLEPLIIEQFEKIEGKKVSPGVKLMHPDHPRLGMNADGLIPSEQAGFEAKSYDWTTKDEWGEPGTDEIPAAYFCQVNWYMGIASYPKWYVAAFNRSSGETSVYVVNFHPDLYQKMESAVLEFDAKYVLPKVQPPFSPLDCDIEYLKQRYNPDASVVIATREIDEAAHRLLDINAKISPLSKEKKELETQIKAAIGEASAIETAVGRFEWRPGKDKTDVNWENVAQGVLAKLPKDEADALVSINTTTTPGTRRFKSPKE